jgi:nitronate monooxygenase
MLEAERAGAKALVVFMDDWPRNGPEWTTLRKIHEEEAHNCALLGKLLEKAGVPYSHATGEFYDKAVAVKGSRERIAFLVKGLRWAIKRFDEALPSLGEEEKALFRRMREIHLRSISTCEALLRALP